jgi:hypothetical protein
VLHVDPNAIKAGHGGDLGNSRVYQVQLHGIGDTAFSDFPQYTALS